MVAALILYIVSLAFYSLSGLAEKRGAPVGYQLMLMLPSLIMILSAIALFVCVLAGV